MSTPVSSPSAIAAATSLALSSLHIRLETLDKEHQWLLKQIKKKRTEQKNFLEQMRSVAAEIHGRCTPCFQKMASLDEEIHRIFDEILTVRKLGKKTRKKIQQVYRNLQLSGIISVKFNGTEDDILGEFFEVESEEENYSSDSFDGDREAQQDFSSANKNSESKK
ncbi:MAG: molecular chaperone DnaJ, partial [Cyanobacteria bacterium J06635_10]